MLLDSAISEKDTITFSSIGYKGVSYLVSGILRQHDSITIKLTANFTQLRQVEVSSRHYTTKILGYDTNSKLFGLGFGSGAIGSEGGIHIPIKHPNVAIESFSFFIIQNPYQHLLFRINVYEFSDGKPGKNLLNENVLMPVDNNKTGKILLDLAKYNIVVNTDVLVTLEWLDAYPKTNTNLAVGASLFGATYIRQASQAAWVKKKFGVGFSVGASY